MAEGASLPFPTAMSCAGRPDAGLLTLGQAPGVWKAKPGPGWERGWPGWERGWPCNPCQSVTASLRKGLWLPSAPDHRTSVRWMGESGLGETYGAQKTGVGRLVHAEVNLVGQGLGAWRWAAGLVSALLKQPPGQVL